MNVAAELRCELKARHAGSRSAASHGERRETEDWWLWQGRVRGRAGEGSKGNQEP